MKGVSLNKTIKDLQTLSTKLLNDIKSNSKNNKIELNKDVKMTYYVDESGKIIPLDKDLELLFTKEEDISSYPKNQLDFRITSTLKHSINNDDTNDEYSNPINISKILDLSKVLGFIKQIKVLNTEYKELLQIQKTFFNSPEYKKLQEEMSKLEFFAENCTTLGKDEKFVKQRLKEFKKFEAEAKARIHDTQANLNEFQAVLNPNYLKAKIFDILLEKDLIVLDIVDTRKEVYNKDNSKLMDDAEKEAILSRPENLNDIPPELLEKLIVKDSVTSSDETTEAKEDGKSSGKDEQDDIINIGEHKSISLKMLVNNVFDNSSDEEIRRIIKILLKDFLTRKMDKTPQLA